MTKQLQIYLWKWWWQGVYCRGWDGGVGDVEEGKWEETDNDDQEKVFVR